MVPFQSVQGGIFFYESWLFGFVLYLSKESAIIKLTILKANISVKMATCKVLYKNSILL